MILRVVENNGNLDIIKQCSIDEVVELLVQRKKLTILDDFEGKDYIKLLLRLCRALNKHGISVFYMSRKKYKLVFTLHRCVNERCRKIFVTRILRWWRKRRDGFYIVQLWLNGALNLLRAMNLYYVYWLGMNPHCTHLSLGKAKHLLRTWFNITPEHWRIRKTKDKKTKVVTFLIKQHQLMMLRKLAEEKKTTPSELIRQAISELLEKYRHMLGYV